MTTGTRRACPSPARRALTRSLVAGLIAATSLLASPSPHAADAPARVTFASLDLDADGKPVSIDAWLFEPAGERPRAGFPAVVALHGCDGPYSARKGHEHELSARHADWASRLAGQGYVVLMPDSFAARGRRTVCMDRLDEPSIRPYVRRLDALGALAFVAARPEVDRERVALLGWSHGGSTVLATINARDERVAAFRKAEGAPPFYRAAIAFYPGCTPSLRAGARWQAAVPLAILIGADDDWTPPAACESLAAAARERGADVALTLYPDAHHGFDGPDGPVRHLARVPTGTRPGQGVHVGANPAARDDARRQVETFLRERLSR